jgi:hypothetical protein
MFVHARASHRKGAANAECTHETGTQASFSVLASCCNAEQPKAQLPV